MYFIQVDGQYEYQADKIAKAHQWCQKADLFQSQEGPKCCSCQHVCSTLGNDALREKWQKRFGARLKVIECTGEYDNIHGVDESTILAMKKSGGRHGKAFPSCRNDLLWHIQGVGFQI
ncbi:hypothetical protein QW180_00870 [Vibrio sinaloensis]|nr:hypothetical protein [Vibrio sinaloensis]